MTLIYQNAPPAGAGTHVLVIGVGKYPYLIDGDQPLAQRPLGLGQLRSPPISAKAVIDWCLATLMTPGAPGFVNASAPLASVEALISAQTPTNITTLSGVQIVDAATLNNIQVAFHAWLARVAGNPGNIGVFYYCGHGVMVSNHYLLAEDFGANNALPWSQAFDVSDTLRAVEREVNGALYFFVDACREISREMALTQGASTNALMMIDISKPVIRASASLIVAAGEGRRAFSVGGDKVARFTEALVMAMSGYCGTKQPGATTWDVDGEVLATAVRKLLEKGNAVTNGMGPGLPIQISEQAIGGSSIPLLRVASAPKVKVELDLTPEQKRALYEMYLASPRGTQYQQKGVNGTFRVEVPKGFYDIGARDPNGGALAPVLHPNEELSPPLYELMMQVPQ